MTRNLQIKHLSILFLLMALSSMALTPSKQVFLSPTSTAKPLLNLTSVVTHTLKPRLTSSPTRPIKKLKPTSSAIQSIGDITVTPVKTRANSIPLELQAGTSDWIVLIGILIVAIIVIPITLKRKEWRGK